MFRLPNEIISGIEDYRKSLSEFTNGKMDVNRFKGIRVPWGFYSHRGGKIFMARIRIPAGTVNSEQLRVIAEASKRFGNGILHVTTRQDIQIHGVKIEDTSSLLDFLKGHNLSPRGGGGNTVRNITSCPLSGICPFEVFDVRPFAIGLTEYLLRDPNSYLLPRKYKIAFSGCSKDCGFATVNDLGFIAKNNGFSVYAGGGMGAISRVGDLLEEYVHLEDVGYIAEAVKRVFFKYGERKDRHHSRLRFLVEKIGFSEFKRLYTEELKRLKDTEYIALRKIELPQYKGSSYIEIKLPLGDIHADKLIALTEIGDYEFRTTQRQNIVIANIKEEDVQDVSKKIMDLGLRVNGPDIICCAGATTCNLGLCNSRGLAMELDGLDGVSINISGCPNACGQHPIGAIGLHGLVRKVGNRPVPFYKILIGGIVEEGKTKLAEEVGIVPARNVPDVIRGYLCGRDLKTIINKYAYVPSYEEDPLFYRDWGKEEDFTLAGIGPGECGAGVIDMINADLESSKVEIEKNNPMEAIHFASRALLVVRGIEPRTRDEAIDGFIKEFVDKGIADPRFRDLKERTDLEYVKDFYNEVKRIYNSMDSSFNFPSVVTEKKEPPGSLLDLRGVACPMNYVKTKLYLEGLDIGSVVEVYLDDGEPIRNVPNSLKNDGHEIIKIEEKGGFYSIIVRKRV